MATLKLENLPPELLSQIEHLAQQNDCTINHQAIALIEQSLNQLPNKDSSWSKRRKAVPHIQAEIDRQTRVNPADFGLPDSTQLIRTDILEHNG